MAQLSTFKDGDLVRKTNASIFDFAYHRLGEVVLSPDNGFGVIYGGSGCVIGYPGDTEGFELAE